MRRFILATLAVLFFLVIIFGTIIGAVAPKALPGNTLYPLRLWSEQLWYVTFASDQNEQTEALLNLLERRIDDLEQVRGTANELGALIYFEAAFDRAAQAIGQPPVQTQSRLQTRLMILERKDRLMTLTERTLAVIDSLALMRALSPEVGVLVLRAKLESMLQIGRNPHSTPTVPPPTSPRLRP